MSWWILHGRFCHRGSWKPLPNYAKSKTIEKLKEFCGFLVFGASDLNIIGVVTTGGDVPGMSAAIRAVVSIASANGLCL